jgi:hypothetical protein
MKSVPVQNQKLGICYSYAATQFADAVRSKRQLERGRSSNISVSSPVFTAMMSKKDWDKRGIRLSGNGSPTFPFEGGSMCNAFNTIKVTGTCSRKKIEEIFGKSNLNNQQYFKKLYKIEERLKAKIEKVKKAHSPDSKNILFSLKNTKNNTGNSSPFSESMNTLPLAFNSKYRKDVLSCKASAVDELFMDFQATFGDSFKISYEFFKKQFSPKMFDNPEQLGMIFRTICQSKDRHEVNTTAKCKDFYGDTSDRYTFTKKILKNLETNSLPVGISYCSSVLTNKPPFRGITKRSPLTFKKNSKGQNICGGHASLIIGSRWNKKAKSCELLVRNSWGTGCKSYKAGYPAKSSIVTGQDIKCEAGNIWVDYKELEKNIYRAQYL